MRYCLDPSQPLRSDIDDLTDDCSKAFISQLVRRSCKFGCTAMDDSIVESPHAMASRLVKSCRAKFWPALCG